MKGQTLLAACYENGTGVPQSDKDALSWYGLAANRFAAEKYSVKDVWAEGKNPGEKENALQRRWENIIEKSKIHNFGSPLAQNKLGEFYFEGKGTAKNPDQAAFWFFAAATKGFPPAQNKLGECFLSGQGAPKDCQTAIFWFRKAVEQGYGPAKANLETALSEAAKEAEREAAKEAEREAAKEAEREAANKAPDRNMSYFLPAILILFVMLALFAVWKRHGGRS